MPCHLGTTVKITKFDQHWSSTLLMRTVHVCHRPLRLRSIKIQRRCRLIASGAVTTGVSLSTMYAVAAVQTCGTFCRVVMQGQLYAFTMCRATVWVRIVGIYLGPRSFRNLVVMFYIYGKISFKITLYITCNFSFFNLYFFNIGFISQI